MQWSKPDFVEITLNMEVTAYVNTDDGVKTSAEQPSRTQEPASEKVGANSA